MKYLAFCGVLYHWFIFLDDGRAQTSVGMLISYATSIIAIFLSIYFYIKSIKKRKPVYLVDSVRTTIFDRDALDLSDLKISHKGVEITGQNVSAARVYFWNAGAAPIRREDILGVDKHILVQTPPGTEILQSSIVQTTRDDVVDAHLSEGDTPNSAKLGFEILERDDGVAIQVIFKGDLYSKISLLGKTLDAEKVEEVKEIGFDLLRVVRSSLGLSSFPSKKREMNRKILLARRRAARKSKRQVGAAITIFFGALFLASIATFFIPNVYLHKMIEPEQSLSPLGRKVFIIVTAALYSLVGFVLWKGDRYKAIPWRLRDQDE